MNILSHLIRTAEEPRPPTFADSAQVQEASLLKNGAKSLFQLDCQRSFNGKMTGDYKWQVFYPNGDSVEENGQFSESPFSSCNEAASTIHEKFQEEELRSVLGELPRPVEAMPFLSDSLPLKGLPEFSKCENSAIPEVEISFNDNDFFQLLPVGLALVGIGLLGYAAWRRHQSSKTLRIKNRQI